MDNFEIKEVCTNLRPAKVAVLIRNGYDWQEKCLKTIELFSQIWGGGKNLIIPTNGEKIDDEFWFLLEKFDPDYFYVQEKKEINEDLKKEILKKLNPFCHRGVGPIKGFFSPIWPLTFLPDILHNTVSEDNIVNPIINFGIRDNHTYVKLMVHSILGKLSGDYCEKMVDLGIEIEEKDFSDNYYIFENIWDEEFNNNFPFEFSMLKLKSYYNVEDVLKIDDSPSILVIGDSIEDFCFYYNLARLRKGVYWAPSCIISTSLNEIKKKREPDKPSISKLTYFFSSLADLCSGIISDNGKIIFTSISKSEADLEEIKDDILNYLRYLEDINLNEAIFVSKNIYEFLPYTLRFLEEDNYSNCYREQFIDSKSINRVKTPIPRNFDHRSFDKHYWITEVNVEGYKLPPYDVLSDSLEALRYSNNQIRVSNNGIAYFCPNVSYMGESIDKYLIKPYINLFSPFKIFEKIFNKFGYSIMNSDKGNYERESTEKFGSLGDMAKFLKNDNYQKLFDKFVGKKNPSSPNEGIYLKDDSRMYMSLKAIEKVLGDEDKYIINHFIEKEILHRGFIFKCEKCKHTGWYDIEDVSIKFKCKRCRKTQYYNSNHLARQNPVEPEWFYKLDEAIYQGYDNDMIVPIMTLNKLKELSENSFSYTNEIEIEKKEKKEIDICCISDGKIIIGECKKQNNLKETEIKKYKDIYNEIGANKIIFSTFNVEGWSEKTQNQIKNILGEEIKYEIFNKKDLIPE